MNIKPIQARTGGNVNKGSLNDLTTRKIERVDVERETTPVELTAETLKSIGVNTEVAQLQKSVVRLRVELNGETVGSGSGFIISSDGLILSVNHVPAVGKQKGDNPLDFVAGTDVLRNMKSWNELLGQKGEVRLVADFPLLPNPDPPRTIFNSAKLIDKSPFEVKLESSALKFFGRKTPATVHSSYEDTINLKTVPIEIIAESPEEDLMLARIKVVDDNEPFPVIQLEGSVPTQGDFVYSIGHPHGIKHNALALGEVVDPNFDVQKIKRAIEAHGVVFNGISNILGGQNPQGSNFLANFAKGLSLQYAGIDVEPLVKFMNGAVISTNNIAPGSSGGLLVNESGKAVGVTYLGFLMPYNNSAILRYGAGVLDFHSRQLPMSNITGSVGIAQKAIPFLEEQGVNIERISDGEPANVQDLAKRASLGKARDAMKVFLLSQGITDEVEQEKRLADAGLQALEEPSDVKSSNKNEVQQQYNVGDQILSSKPVEVVSIILDGDNEDSTKITQVFVKIILKTEKNPDGEEVILIIDPSSFDMSAFADSETRELITSWLTNEKDYKTLNRLSELQRQIEINTQNIEDGNVASESSLNFPFKKPDNFDGSPCS